jgi:hypothetical protein
LSRSAVSQDSNSERVLDIPALIGSADHGKIVQLRDFEDTKLKPENMAKTVGVSLIFYY